jgi:hypothetical protein
VSAEDLHATITARAELDRQFMRQMVEATTSALSKSLSSFLDRIDQSDTARAREHQLLLAAVERVGVGIDARVSALETALAAREELTTGLERVLSRWPEVERLLDG